MTGMHDPRPLPLRPGRRGAWVTWTIVGSTVAVFIWQLIVAHHAGTDRVGDRLAFSPAAWHHHRYWTVLTYAWAHSVSIFNDPGLFWLHIVANMIPVVCLGPALEELLGHGRYLGLYLGGAIAAALIWFLFNPHSPEGVIGASGAVFALIAGAGAAAPRARVEVYLFYVLPVRMNLATLAAVVCGLEVAQIFFKWMPDLAHSAHLGGAAFGLLYVLLLRVIG